MDIEKKKRVSGKSKGNSNERKISNLFSKRFAAYTGISQSFRRNPDSGSFWGASNQKRTETHNLEFAIFGDLICPRAFNFSIECKHYKTAPGFQSVMQQKVKQWDEWLVQVTQDSENAGKFPVLITKYNNVDEIVFLQTELPQLRKRLEYKNWHIYLLDDWLGLEDNYFFTK